ncbi:hypothetical protein [Vibrio owensii]|uniref:Uncharacterized protein n=1 Tax=Vibrio owensii CAIM 1854 = LMG 25443 TaxID=1229493 RepID=A0A0C1W7Z0_9VIBR|nr:hypothetical protein [Vibrio owensii]KIF52487.1 hypothetical protein H735_13980 [Vibrio owensii CAIM 1854 = LMG 25443]HCG8476250.1 hypothetical protein [Vibrio parahaemolyticus]
MPNNDDKDKPSTSKLPVTLKPVDFEYKKPVRRNELVEPKKYDKIDSNVGEFVKLGTNGVVYVDEEDFSNGFQTTKPKGAYIFENQIPDSAKKSFDGKNYAHSSAVVGLADKKSQEVRDSEKQALLQYYRDSLLNVSDSAEAQDMRRKVDSFTKKELPKLRNDRGVNVDEVTGEDKQKGFAFHHVNPKELHTDPEDVLDPTKGRNLNPKTHADVHRNNVNDEAQFEEYKAKNKPK